MKTNTKPSNIHCLLGGKFFDKATPAIFPNHVLRFRNDRAASRLNLDKINESIKLIKEKLSASNTAYAFNLRRPGLVEKWIAPLLKRLVVLDLWKPDIEIKEWIDLSLVMQEEGGSEGSDVVERIKLFHTTGEGKVRPDWVDVETEETVWR